MAWYDFFGWSREASPGQKADPVLYCDSRGCGKPIADDEILYDGHNKTNQEIYHTSESCERRERTRRWLISDIRLSYLKPISRRKALGLLQEGKLKQSRNPEGRAA